MWRSCLRIPLAYTDIITYSVQTCNSYVDVLCLIHPASCRGGVYLRPFSYKTYTSYQVPQKSRLNLRCSALYLETDRQARTKQRTSKAKPEAKQSRKQSKAGYLQDGRVGKRRCRAKWRWTEGEGIRGARQLGWPLDAYPYLLLLPPFSILPTLLLTRLIYMPLPLLRIKKSSPSRPRRFFLRLTPIQWNWNCDSPFIKTLFSTRNYFSHEKHLLVENQTSDSVISPSSYRQTKQVVVNVLPPSQVRKRVESTDITPLSISPSPRPASLQNLISA